MHDRLFGFLDIIKPKKHLTTHYVQNSELQSCYHQFSWYQQFLIIWNKSSKNFSGKW